MKTSILLLATATLLAGCSREDSSGTGGTERQGGMEKGGHQTGTNRSGRSTGPSDSTATNVSGGSTGTGDTR